MSSCRDPYRAKEEGREAARWEPRSYSDHRERMDRGLHSDYDSCDRNYRDAFNDEKRRLEDERREEQERERREEERRLERMREQQRLEEEAYYEQQMEDEREDERCRLEQQEKDDWDARRRAWEEANG